MELIFTQFCGAVLVQLAGFVALRILGPHQADEYDEVVFWACVDPSRRME